MQNEYYFHDYHISEAVIVASLNLFPSPATLKILIVVDGSVSFNTFFGLGKLIETLEAPAYNWVTFDVTLATRGGPSWAGASPGPYQPTYTDFRFDMTESDSSPTINKYDQIWCFGFEPGNFVSGDDDITDESANPTSDTELKFLTRWMNERQGGLFATGDHHVLGASMCHRIPRVSTMRKWTIAQGVPTQGGPTRHDTNRPATPEQANIGAPGGPEEMPNNNERDGVPQEIELKLYPTASWSPFYHASSPHPILCDRENGVINVFPDHPHEGWIYEDADVVKTGTYDFEGYAGDDYPTVDGVRPLPEVIAWANTLPDPPYDFAKGDTPQKRFGLIGVYDGQRIGLGRVVVDSTWHHWFTMNLEGLEANNPAAYAKIQTYFRNVGIWLATAAQRSKMLTAATWVSIFTYPAVEEYSLSLRVWELGEVAKDVIGRSASKCLIRTWVLEIIDFNIARQFLLRRPEPCLSCPPFDLVEIFTLGGIIREMLPEAARVQRLQHREGFRLNTETLAKSVVNGIQAGVGELARLYSESLQRGARIAEALPNMVRQGITHERFMLSDEPRPDRFPPREEGGGPQGETDAKGRRRVRIILERVQILDDQEPWIFGRGEFVFTSEVKINGRTAADGRRRFPERGAYKVSDRPRGNTLDLNELIFDGAVEEGDTLSVSVMATEEDVLTADDEMVRYVRHFRGDPAGWAGYYQPGDEELDPEDVGEWRVWLQVI